MKIKDIKDTNTTTIRFKITNDNLRFFGDLAAKANAPVSEVLNIALEEIRTKYGTK